MKKILFIILVTLIQPSHALILFDIGKKQEFQNAILKGRKSTEAFFQNNPLTDHIDCYFFQEIDQYTTFLGTAISFLQQTGSTSQYDTVIESITFILQYHQPNIHLPGNYHNLVGGLSSR